MISCSFLIWYSTTWLSIIEHCLNDSIRGDIFLSLIATVEFGSMSFHDAFCSIIMFVPSCCVSNVSKGVLNSSQYSTATPGVEAPFTVYTSCSTVPGPPGGGKTASVEAVCWTGAREGRLSKRSPRTPSLTGQTFWMRETIKLYITCFDALSSDETNVGGSAPCLSPIRNQRMQECRHTLREPEQIRCSRPELNWSDAPKPSEADC